MKKWTSKAQLTCIRKIIVVAGASFEGESRGLANIWKASDISRIIKVSLFKSLVLSISLEG